MFIHSFYLCPLGLNIKLNFNISKVAYSVMSFCPSRKELLKDNFQLLPTITRRSRSRTEYLLANISQDRVYKGTFRLGKFSPIFCTEPAEKRIIVLV